jgi:hypothetical protein
MASIADLRFLLSRVRFDWLPEEQGGLAPLGPTGIRRNQGFANHSQNPLALNWWFGAGDTLFPGSPKTGSRPRVASRTTSFRFRFLPLSARQSRW